MEGKEEFDPVMILIANRKRSLSLRALLAQQIQQSGIECEGFHHSETTA